MMNKTVIGLTAVGLLMGGAAQAGSLKDTEEYVAPTPVWTGLYFGGHVGYATGEWDGTTKTTAGDPTPKNHYSGIDESDQSIDGQGHFIGGQVGYNFQRDRIVFGVEGDVSFSNFDGSDTWTAYDDGEGYAWRKEHDLELDRFGTARARVGYAMDNGMMPYLTGGFAWAETSGDLAVTYFDQESDAVDGTSYADVEETHMGWTVGGGIESMVSENWSLKAEYLYVDLGEEDYRFKGKTYSGGDFDTDYYESDLSFHSFRLGLNYRLPY